MPRLPAVESHQCWNRSWRNWWQYWHQPSHTWCRKIAEKMHRVRGYANIIFFIWINMIVITEAHKDDFDEMYYPKLDMCLWNTDAPVGKKSQNMAKISKSYILTPPHPQGHGMSVKCEQPLRWTYSQWLGRTCAMRHTRIGDENVPLFL